MIDEQTTPGSHSGLGGLGAIGSLLQVGASLYDSYQNRKVQARNVDKTIAAQKAEAELAYQRSVDMWHMQNAYNSPEAQMQRFTAAGLNPQLIYQQGSSGLASSPAQYQPANLQYKYAAPEYGSAFQSVLPTLMAVGTWIQNMRLSQAELASKQTNTERARQVIDYLTQANPKLLAGLENRLSLYPYQLQMQRYLTDQAGTKLFDMEQDFRYRYGEGLFSDLGSAFQPAGGKFHDIQGLRKLQFLQEQSKTKLLDAKSSWSEFDITDPQAIIQLVLSGVMGLAGQTLRLSTHRRPSVTHEVEERMRSGRQVTRRRVYKP